MAYVSKDADALVDALKFVSIDAEVKTFAMGEADDHLNTVNEPGKEIASAKAVIVGLSRVALESRGGGCKVREGLGILGWMISCLVCLLGSGGL